MAKAKKAKTAPKKKRSKAEEPEKERNEKDSNWDDDYGSVQQGLLVIVLFAIAAISFLSFIGAAGDFGTWVDTFFGWLFGWGRYVTPIMFAVLGYVFLHPEKYEIRIVNYIGLALFLLSGLALLHLFLPIDQLFSAAKEGRGGGYLGIVLAYPLIRFTGVWATIVVLIGSFLASWLIMFNTTLMSLFAGMNVFRYIAAPFTWVRSRVHALRNGYHIDGDDEDAEEDEDDEEYEEEDDLEEEMTETEEEVKAVFASKEVSESDEVELRSDPEQMELIPQKPKKRRSKKIDMPVKLLNANDDKPKSGDIENCKTVIHDTLESFGIDVEMDEVSVGPMVTQYTLRPAQGVKLTQITTLHNDIALALAAHPIRIEAPIPGKALVGIEVPNKAAAVVSLRELVDSKKFKQAKGDLAIALGKAVSGKPYYAALETMPHVLIAGATGSGKSVCINGLIVSLLYQHTPDTLRFIMVDPKRVELTVYNDIPHLLTPVITDVEKTINALKWTVAEMDRRYELLSRIGKRNIKTYNESVPEDEKLPYIVFIIDELADLMSVAASSVEAAIVRLAQMSRAVGIHLVLATQRPSVNVITGLIKANMPARIAFSVASLIDSRTILDFAGAEKLLGRGDMLYLDATLSKPTRLQGAFVDDGDIENIVEYLRNQGDPDYDNDVTEKPARGAGGGSSAFIDGDEDSDELLPEAKEVILEAGKASASMLQRRLRVGYARAARILDILEEEGFIGPADGSKPREVLVSSEEDIPDDEIIDDEEEYLRKREQGIEMDDGQEEDDDEEYEEEDATDGDDGEDDEAQ